MNPKEAMGAYESISVNDLLKLSPKEQYNRIKNSTDTALLKDLGDRARRKLTNLAVDKALLENPFTPAPYVLYIGVKQMHNFPAIVKEKFKKTDFTQVHLDFIRDIAQQFEYLLRPAKGMELEGLTLTYDLCRALFNNVKKPGKEFFKTLLGKAEKLITSAAYLKTVFVSSLGKFNKSLRKLVGKAGDFYLSRAEIMANKYYATLFETGDTILYSSEQIEKGYKTYIKILGRLLPSRSTVKQKFNQVLDFQKGALKTGMGLSRKLFQMHISPIRTAKKAASGLHSLWKRITQ